MYWSWTPPGHHLDSTWTCPALSWQVPSPDGRWGARRRRWAFGSLPFALLLLLIEFQVLARGSAPAAFSLALPCSLPWSPPWSPPSLPVWGVLVLLGGVLGTIGWKRSTAAVAPRWLPLLVLLGFVCSTAWLSLLANEIVAIVEALGLLLGVSSSILGLTVVGVGNSLGDLVADTSAARGAHVQMAIAGCFGSPISMNLVGLGASLALRATRAGPVSFSISPQCAVAYAFLTVALLSHALAFPYRKRYRQVQLADAPF